MDSAAPSEMEIVDTFTHVIFCGGEELSQQEQSILDTLCRIDRNAAGCSLGELPGELGGYLRSLGVREMVELVAKVRECYLHPDSLPVQKRSPAGKDRRARF